MIPPSAFGPEGQFSTSSDSGNPPTAEKQVVVVIPPSAFGPEGQFSTSSDSGNPPTAEKQVVG